MMPRALAIIDRVHRVVQQLRESSDADAIWFAETVALWLAGAEFDATLGLAGGWRDTVRQRAQCTALQAMKRDLPPGSARSLAREIADRLLAYETTSWKTDRAAGRRPPGHAGNLYDYLAADGPTSFETIRKLIPWVIATDELTHAAA